MLEIEFNGPVARVVLNRPDVHNAFNDVLVERITGAFEDLADRREVRAVVLAGNGKSFCAGGDLNWMRQTVGLSFEENRSGAATISRMLRAVAACPKLVIARVHGPALGGGAGLVAAVDIALAVKSAVFGFTEVRLGVVAGVISPFVLPRIGAGHAREYFTTGEKFSADTAHRIGLVHSVYPDLESLDTAIDSKLGQVLEASPSAVAATKALIAEISSRDMDSATDYAERALARARSSEEGQAGMKSFLEGRKPPWMMP